ncbi:hypothetical protein HPB50_006495 [Hyalomma asiaticum]|uniref:Uncharacterized protein n=1 Tax=Hyalomma asiaticum TaxID=266040 RepID=A0ACB7SCS0_HYAAI|nr:hypothetical protein HPB50_006495 [Hyalomma asiaticum]
MVAISLAFREPPWIRCERTKRSKGPEETRRTSLTTAKSETATVASSNMDALGKLRGVLNCGITYVLVVTWIVFSYNCDVFLSTIVDFLMDKGQPLEEAVSFITYTSITDLVGRALLPFTVDRFFRDDLASYDGMFWVLGSFSFTVSAVWFLLRLHDRKSTRKWQPRDVRI